jgi:hypothetical protein
MNDNIVPPKRRNVRILGRPKTRVCSLVSLAAAAVSGAAFVARDAHGSWLPVLVSAAVAVIAGLLALVFRLKEQPRQMEVRDFWDGEPPVIHVRER